MNQNLQIKLPLNAWDDYNSQVLLNLSSRLGISIVDDLLPSQKGSHFIEVFFIKQKNCLGLLNNTQGWDFICSNFCFDRKRYQNTLLNKALGNQKNKIYSCLDATGGLGIDAFCLAVLLKTKITVLELNPILALLINDALIRASLNAKLTNIASNIEVTCMNALDYMRTIYHKKQYVDLVYLDPMFTTHDTKRGAAPKKPLQLCHLLAGLDQNGDQLLTEAFKIARNKIIVKRGKNSPTLNKMKPNYTVVGKSCRYDVYIMTQ